MSEYRADTPEQDSYGAQVQEVGQAIVTKIQRAADLSNENCDRALALAHKLSMQLRAAEDRINQLEAEARRSPRICPEQEGGYLGRRPAVKPLPCPSHRRCRTARSDLSERWALGWWRRRQLSNDGRLLVTDVPCV